MLNQILAQERRNSLLKEAEQWRLMKQAQAGQSSVTERLLGRLGSLLVDAGQWLRRRYSSPHTNASGWVVDRS